MGHSGITNYVIPVRGSSVTAYLGVRDSEPFKWYYSLWTGEGDDETLIATGQLDMSIADGVLPITPDQAARIAFLLEVEYA